MSLAIIKPDAVKAGLVEDIIAKVCSKEQEGEGGGIGCTRIRSSFPIFLQLKKHHCMSESHTLVTGEVIRHGDIAAGRENTDKRRSR